MLPETWLIQADTENEQSFYRGVVLKMELWVT